MSLASSTDHHSNLLSLLILSSPTERGQRLRCFQRTLLKAFAAPSSGTSGGQWLRLRGGGSLRFHYALSRPRKRASVEALERERALHGDLLVAAHIPDGHLTCAAKIFWGLGQILALRPRARFFGIADDDTFLHPPRIAQDLLELAQHRRELLYGQIGLAAGWSDARDYHHGWHFFSDAHGPLDSYEGWQKQLARGNTGPGPFPLPYGFCMVVSAGAAARIVAAPHVEALQLRSLARARAERRRGPNRRAKCRPGGDGALGWALCAARVEKWGRRGLGTHGRLCLKRESARLGMLPLPHPCHRTRSLRSSLASPFLSAQLAAAAGARPDRRRRLVWQPDAAVARCGGGCRAEPGRCGDAQGDEVA